MLGWSIAVLGRCGATTTRTFVKRFDATIVGWSFPIRQGVARIAASIFQGGTLACHPVWHWPRASHLSEMAPTRKEFLQGEERSDGKFRQAFVLCSDKPVSRCAKERNVAQCTWQRGTLPSMGGASSVGSPSQRPSYCGLWTMRAHAFAQCYVFSSGGFFGHPLVNSRS